MLDEDEHGCGSIGRWNGVFCAALGVGTALLMVRAMGLGWFILPYPPPKELLIGLLALFIAAASLGKKAGIYLCGKSYDLALNVLVGLGVAFGSITIAVLTGTLVGFLSEADQILRSGNFTVAGFVLGFFSPLLVVLLFGGIPAVFLGVLYGFLVRNRLRKLNR